jgi:hypothetical protein
MNGVMYNIRVTDEYCQTYEANVESLDCIDAKFYNWVLDFESPNWAVEFTVLVLL